METFGEDVIMQRIDITKPEYIIINNYDTSNYYYSAFGKDYAGRITLYIMNNYEFLKSIGDDFSFTVYKKVKN